MKKFALLIILLLPLACANETWGNPVDPDGYLDEWLQSMGSDSTSDEIMGGGGNPVSGFLDPIIDMINQGLGTTWGFLLVYTLLFLFAGYFLVPLVGGLIFSYLAYYVGSSFNFEYTFIAMLIAAVIGAIIFWRFTHKGDKLDHVKHVIKWLFILTLLAILALIGLKLFNFTIPGVTY